MDYNHFSIAQLREILTCVEAEGDRGKIEILKSTELLIDLVNIISDYASAGIKIYSTDGAFAAVLKDGRVVTWGNEIAGGRIPDNVQAELDGQDVKHIYSTGRAFAALLENGRVVTWGRAERGGMIPRRMRAELKDNVKEIYSAPFAFAALLENGSVVTWGAGGRIPDDIRDQIDRDRYNV